MAFDKDIEIGFLRQDIEFVEGRTILEEAYHAINLDGSISTGSKSFLRKNECKKSKKTRVMTKFYLKFLDLLNCII